MIDYVSKIKKQGDTVGGVVTCVVQNVSVGLGEPVFNKLHAALGQAMLSINAVKGFEYGSGFEGAAMRGSDHNDIFNSDGSTKSNHSGGIQGGISNGMDIYFKVAFKPVATLIQKQMTIDSEGNEVEMMGKGRHDPWCGAKSNSYCRSNDCYGACRLCNAEQRNKNFKDQNLFL